MLNFLRDLFRPAEEPAKLKQREDRYDYFNDGWCRSDQPEDSSRPVRFRMGAPKIPQQGYQRVEPTAGDLMGGGR